MFFKLINFPNIVLRLQYFNSLRSFSVVKNVQILQDQDILCFSKTGCWSLLRLSNTLAIDYLPKNDSSLSIFTAFKSVPLPKKQFYFPFISSRKMSVRGHPNFILCVPLRARLLSITLLLRNIVGWRRTWHMKQIEKFHPYRFTKWLGTMTLKRGQWLWQLWLKSCFVIWDDWG